MASTFFAIDAALSRSPADVFFRSLTQPAQETAGAFFSLKFLFHFFL